MELENLILNSIWLKTAGERGRKRPISIIYIYIIIFKIYSIENFLINFFVLDWFRKSGEQRDCDGYNWICYSYYISIRKRFTFAPIQNDQSCQQLVHPGYFRPKIFWRLNLCWALIIGTVANSLVLYSMVHRMKHKNQSEYFILQTWVEKSCT